MEIVRATALVLALLFAGSARAQGTSGQAVESPDEVEARVHGFNTGSGSGPGAALVPTALATADGRSTPGFVLAGQFW